MDSSEPDVFVDHVEKVLVAPPRRQLSASKMDLPVQETEDMQDFRPDKENTTQCQDQSPAPGGPDSTEQSLSTNAETSSSVTVTTDSTTSKESSSTSSTTSTTTTKVQKHATTIYTQRISGRSSKSSDSGSDVSSPTPDEAGAGDANEPVFGSRETREAQSPTEVCSVQFNVAAGVTSSTTTAFSKVFTKTVETTEEVTSKERHLSECNITVGGERGSEDRESGELPPSTQRDANQNAASTDDGNNVFSETTTNVKAEEDKEVSEYCPGLAIRTLTLEDLKEKKTSPEREASPTSSADNAYQSQDMSTRSLFYTATTSTSSQPGFFSSYASQTGSSVSAPTDNKSSESSLLHKPVSETSTTYAGSSPTPGSSLTSSGHVVMQCSEDTAAALTFRKPFFNPIEVERKFTISADTEERLKALSARLHKEKVFTDVYYDTDDYDLILTDCWLRRRNDRWEVKMPLPSQNPNALFAPASQYREVDDEKEISAWLVDRLGLDSWMKGDPVDLLVHAARLSEFARFTTTRRSYTLPSCVVDLDLTDHGFRVGEIEVMAASPEEVPQALHTISEVAQQLGVDECAGAVGKMTDYLLRFNPHLYQRLVGRARSVT